jgi:hypothetical protein
MALTWSGELPVRVGRRLADAGYDVRQLLGEVKAVAPW